MVSRTLGTLTIGQAPRPDVTPIIDAHVPSHVRQIHSGLLDGLSRAEIDGRYGAEPGAGVLVTRLLDASAVQVSARKAHDGVRTKLAELEAAGCDVILLLCTGQFHGLACERSFLLEPDLIIPPAAAGLIGQRQLGVIVPLASQMRSESGKWGALTRAPIFAAANPYADSLDTLAHAGSTLKERHAQALLLDCMGFTEQHRRAVADATGLPVILSNALMGKVVGELLA
jgi:protein AroM